MSSGGGAAAAGGGGIGRVSMPSNVRKTIENIKEITGNHSEEEIYAMLKECSMDPNETADKLLLQDTFHEVKRKRGKRKENKEPVESRWKPGMQGRGSRGSRGSSSSRNNSHDAGGGRNLALGKENGPSQVLGKGVNVSSLATAQETKSKEAIYAPSSSTANAKVPTVVASGNISVAHDLKSSSDSAAGKAEGLLEPADSKKNSVITHVCEDQSRQQVSVSSNSTAVQSPGPYFSASDPVLLPSQDSRHPNAVGTIKREVGSQRTNTDQIPSNSDKNKSASATSNSGSSIAQGKLPNKVHVLGKNHHSESSQNATSVHASSSVSRPSSNYNNRSQVIGPQKVGPNMEWKPKPTNPSLVHGSGTAASSEAPAVAIEANTNLQPKSDSIELKGGNVELQRKLEELHVSDGQYVIIPNHLHVPEADKLGFCFGSFDASFGINTSHNSTPESYQSALSETTDGNEEPAEEQYLSNQNAFATEEVDYPDNNQTTSYNVENLSSNEGAVSSTVVESNEPKQETVPGGNQYSVAHTSPNYSFGFMQPVVGNPLPPFEGSEAQVRDVSRLPTFVVQQPFDPASFYAQFYRSGADTDGRISPFHSGGVATKYNGNFAVVSPQTSQSAQEGSPLVLSTAAPTPLVNQAPGVLQNSMAVTQQPLSVFRPATGLHLPHYPPNYIPYGHYFPPFYVPPPAIPQFLSNGAFPQQPQGSNVYPTPPAAAAAATKYPLPQYKPGAHTNNSSHVGMPGSYSPYGTSMTAAAGNSTSNEDLAAPHFKESNSYASGLQSEGSGVWIAQSGRDMCGLQASSFYNLPQGQMAFSLAQPSHGTFASVYHPAQPVNATTVHPLLQQSQTMAGPVDMVGPTANVYQQAQHSQINWPSNF